jgi:two-component system chemotaxis response regulator CheB
MGKDGAADLLRLRGHGAMTFSQDEASSVVYGMPREAWEQGGSAVQLPLENIAAHIVRLAATPPTRAAAR